jgi:hypothetical protein
MYSRAASGCGSIIVLALWGTTMRWIWLLLALLGFAFAFATKSPGLMGLGLVLGFIFLLVAFFAFAAERVSANARPDSALLTDKDIAALRASMRKPNATASTATAPGTSSSDP